MQRVERARRTVREMLGDRGYTVGEASTLDHGYAIFARRTEPDERVCAVFPRRGRVGVQYVRALEAEPLFRDVHLILAHDGAITPFANQQIKALGIECFHVKQLQFNVTKHVLVPRHTVLTSAQKARLLHAHKWKPTSLPYIHATGANPDPVARYYNMTPGQVVRIHGSCPDGVPEISYRIAV